jgi:hypothetical protein
MGVEENPDGTIGESHDSSGRYPVPRHAGDTPGPNPPAKNNPTETEGQLKARKFAFAAWLDNMGGDEIKALWRRIRNHESSS